MMPPRFFMLAEGRRATVSRVSAPAWLAICIALAASRVFAQSAAPPSEPPAAPPDDTRHRFVARPMIDFTFAGPPEMRMPTDVAVSRDGVVYVADGVNDRIVAFRPDGDFLYTIGPVGAEKLSHPAGIDVDAAGQLWIADSGSGRIVVVDPARRAEADGGLVRVLELPAPAASPTAAADKAARHPPDPTDVAVHPDGNVVWIVDNDHHVLIRHDLERGTHLLVGRQGEARGQLHFPFMLAMDSRRRVLVTDVLNGRVGVFSDTGAPLATISEYGVEPGMTYRPKGVACGAEDNVWISDSVMGVVQVFDSAGRFLDALRDEAGKVLKLAAPMGLVFDAAGNLYVVELDAHRVRKLEVLRSRVPPPRVPPVDRRPSVVGRQARGCTVCHLEWVEPLGQGRGTELVSPPADDPAHPYVSQSHTCLSCHDASIVDSRRRVWLEHGHNTGVEPPPDMRIPPGLPLVEGRIACRTCHSAHFSGQFTTDMSTAVFLRVDNSAGELCISCHSDKTRGPQRGTHPTGGMPWAVPDELLRAGARIGPNPRELTCLVCHTPHGAAHDHLLVMGTESNQLCLSCHDQMRPGMFRDGDHTEHPLSPLVDAEQKAAVHALGTRLGPDDKLICLSCHKLHHGKGERFLLASELTEGEFCLGCHSDKTSVLGTPHDLRDRFPEERNRLGMTAHSGGPCSSCHLFHRYARTPEISDVDPRGGKCITCHQPGRCAGEKSLGPVNHPQAACVECHDPHQPKPAYFLREATPSLCLKCHTDYAALTGGPHDWRVTGGQWPLAEAGATAGEASPRPDTCLACHRPHGNEVTSLFTFAPAAVDAAADGACIACHPGAAWKNDLPDELRRTAPHAAMHPQAIPAGFVTGAMPLARSTSTGEAVVGCRSCHNPHLPDGHEHKFLRTQPGQPSASLCAACHTDVAAIEMTAHTADAFADKSLPSRSCLPCHSVHAMPTAVQDELLWPLSLARDAGPRGATQIADQRCEACHYDGGPARPPLIATHPVVPMVNLFDAPGAGGLPLFNAEGRPDPQGTIACRTCHTPHGHLPDATFAAADRTRPELRAARLMLRPFAAPNVCTTCHGADALSRFLYFHDPRRRNPPRSDPTAERTEPAEPPASRRSVGASD